MKNLILSTLVAAVSLQTTACVSEDSNRIAVTWNYKINNAIQPACPVGVSNVNLKIKSLDGGLDQLFVYGCDQPTMIEYVDDGDYQIWVEFQNSNGSVYAQSLSVVHLLVGEDLDITADIHEDKGYFFYQWSLKGNNSQAPLTCAQVPALDSIGLLATKVGTAQGTDTTSECNLGAAASLALDTALYTVVIDAVDSSNRSLGSTGPATNQPIDDRNQVTDLGTVVIPITGL